MPWSTFIRYFTVLHKEFVSMLAFLLQGSAVRQRNGKRSETCVRGEESSDDSQVSNILNY